MPTMPSVPVRSAEGRKTAADTLAGAVSRLRSSSVGKTVQCPQNGLKSQQSLAVIV